ncbi:hypothetical protein CDAR_37691 [Caerostris darwini]|uniref:Uncharacterized protein n=1 Tax=Caerostris darwini TaxID=1538125 RepID=A0AAV4V860_9ARAC|nr:hypothetical protein CDAR_37691 [Caerostris darwini]
MGRNYKNVLPVIACRDLFNHLHFLTGDKLSFCWLTGSDRVLEENSSRSSNKKMKYQRRVHPLRHRAVTAPCRTGNESWKKGFSTRFSRVHTQGL